MWNCSRPCVRGVPLARLSVQNLVRHVTSPAPQRPYTLLDLPFHQQKYPSHVAGRSAPPQVVRCSVFSTNIEDVQKDTEPKSYIQKVKKVLKDYGTVAVVFHTAISLFSYGTCYFLVKHGLDVDKVLHYFNVHSSGVSKGASTAAIAYLLHKIFLPVRATTTIVCAPLIVKQLRIKGWMKQVPNPSK